MVEKKYVWYINLKKLAKEKRKRIKNTLKGLVTVLNYCIL